MFLISWVNSTTITESACKSRVSSGIVIDLLNDACFIVFAELLNPWLFWYIDCIFRAQTEWHAWEKYCVRRLRFACPSTNAIFVTSAYQRLVLSCGFFNCLESLVNMFNLSFVQFPRFWAARPCSPGTDLPALRWLDFFFHKHNEHEPLIILLYVTWILQFSIALLASHCCPGPHGVLSRRHDAACNMNGAHCNLLLH